jgi:hypothetical protein
LKVFSQCDNLCFQTSNDPVFFFQPFFECFFNYLVLF